MTVSEIQDADIPDTLKQDILQSFMQPTFSEYVPSHH